jgi:hypothetical protein
MLKNIVFLILCSFALDNSAQFVEVQYDYNNVGDCIFSASNNGKTPVYLNIVFTSIENTRYPEPWPYVKKLDPGFTGLFTLMREPDANAPHFIFEIKTFKSNPVAEVNLDFPYLVPFAPGSIVKPVDVKGISGFWGVDEPKSWQATGFSAIPGQAVYAARQGEVVEISGEIRNSDSKTWYNTWTNTITLLQPDGTLITYKNVVDAGKKLELNQIVHAGQVLGEVAPGSTEIVLMIYHNTLNSPDLQFIIPLFVTAPGKTEILNSALNIEVVHPNEVRGLEMTKKEQRNLLKEK